jgi:glutathione S-transferase
MITIHHLGISQSERIIWLCEELGVPYALKRYDRDPTTRMAPAAYKALHPMGIAPVINDGETVLAESGAIVEYIIAKYGDGRLALTTEDPNFAEYLFWLQFANATMMPALMAGLIGQMAGLDLEGPLAKGLFGRSTLGYRMIEDRLAANAYFAGQAFTAADIMMLFPLTTMRAFAPADFGNFPSLLAYLQRIGQRPAYQRAMAKGDPGFTPMLS